MKVKVDILQRRIFDRQIEVTFDAFIFGKKKRFVIFVPDNTKEREIQGKVAAVIRNYKYSIDGKSSIEVDV